MLVDGISEQVLGFLVRGPLDKIEQVCLAPGMKKDRFNYRILNGYGGKMHYGETVPTAMLRELCDESKLKIRSTKTFHKVALFDIALPMPENEKPKYGVSGVKTVRLHVFLIEGENLSPEATAEMGEPKWFDASELPFGQMHPGVKLWLSRVLNGECLLGRMTSRADGSVSEYEFERTPWGILGMKIAP